MTDGTVWREIVSSRASGRQFDALEHFARQHARLVSGVSHAFGLIGTLSSLVSVSLPGIIRLDAYASVILMHLVLMCSHVIAVRLPRVTTTVTCYSVGALTLLVMYAALPSTGPTPAFGAAVCLLAGLGVGAIGVVMTSSRGLIAGNAIALGGTLLSIIIGCVRLGMSTSIATLVSVVVLMWVVCLIIGFWLDESIAHVMRRIVSIGRAHSVERRASETEAQRLRDARLLHDTALATLTLLAHSGVGVDEDAMRAQAASDGELLRRLRAGESPAPRSSGEYTLTHTAELHLGGTLDAVKQRFAGSLLHVNWHGSGQIGLAPSRLDAFIHALVECIENVRRHAGVDEAHVTLSDDGTTVRGVVTDAGVGFDPSEIADGHLGWGQSVVARIRDIGGNVRVFSSPGAGTTVVIEVPK